MALSVLPGQRTLSAIDAEDLRTLPRPAAALAGLWEVFRDFMLEETGRPENDDEVELLALLRVAFEERPTTHEALVKQVAAIYRAGGRSPHKAVRETLIISGTYASKLIREARDLGLLPPTTQGRASGPPHVRVPPRPRLSRARPRSEVR